MTLLGSTDTYEEIDEGKTLFSSSLYKKDDNDSMSMSFCIWLSTFLHPITAGLVWLLVFVLALFGITFSVFDKPTPKPKDIEFVLVNKEATPINQNTKYRADRDSRAGGVHDPNRPVSQPIPATKSSKPQKASPSSVNKSKSNSLSQPKKQNLLKNNSPQKVEKKSSTFGQKNSLAPKPQGVPKAPTSAPKPSIVPNAPKVTKPNGNFNIPVPKIDAPKVAGPTGSQIAGSKVGSGGNTGSSGSGSSSTPAPSFSPSSSGSAIGGRFSPSGTGSSGSVGNPGPGNPKGAPGIDALKQPDFGPYMRELQRRIKANWEPPKGNESKRVILLFTIARDGRLISNKVYRSSGLQSADMAAKHAVELSAPYKPLPPEYKGDSIDIQFTFDYNVFGPTNY